MELPILEGPEAAVAAPSVRAAYQPIVDLETGTVVAHEALARGDLPPDEMFRRARAGGRLAELDWACRAAAVQGALDGELRDPACLFVNVEPETLGLPTPDHLAHVLAAGDRAFRVVMEVTERALTKDPAALITAVAAARRRGWGIALDDVGADPASLALMPFVAPDVIKLDLRLIQQHPDGEVAAIVNAVLAEAERTGARILAEGIETERHLHRALAMGATLGQGWYFGRPAALAPTDVIAPLERLVAAPADGRTPFESLPTRTRIGVATKELLLPMSHHLERQAVTAWEPPVLVAAFEDASHFTPGTARRYRRLAERCSFVGALAAGMGSSPVPGVGNVRGGDLGMDDPLRGEWVVAVVGPHFAGALIAKDLMDEAPDRERRFAYAVTYDREVVVGAARTLLGRISPSA